MYVRPLLTNACLVFQVLMQRRSHPEARQEATKTCLLKMMHAQIPDQGSPCYKVRVYSMA